MRLLIAVLTVLLTQMPIAAADQRWSIAVCRPEADSRRTAIDEAVAFWNDQLSKLHAKLSQGPIAPCDRSMPDGVLVRISEGILPGQRVGRLPCELDSVQGDIIVVLSGADLVSVGGAGAGGRRGLTILRRVDVPPLSLPNVARNVIAHELGHVLGLSHNAEPCSCVDVLPRAGRRCSSRTRPDSSR